MKHNVTVISLFFSPLSRLYLIFHPRQNLSRQLSKSGVENFNVVEKYPALKKGLCQALRLAIFSFSEIFSFFLKSLGLCFLESSGHQEFSEKISDCPG